MTDAEFKALTGFTFPLSLNDLPAALDKLAAAGYAARVVDQGPGNLGLVVEEKESPCQLTTRS